jgi:hypothetical protein
MHHIPIQVEAREGRIFQQIPIKVTAREGRAFSRLPVPIHVETHEGRAFQPVQPEGHEVKAFQPQHIPLHTYMGESQGFNPDAAAAAAAAMHAAEGRVFQHQSATPEMVNRQHLPADVPDIMMQQMEEQPQPRPHCEYMLILIVCISGYFSYFIYIHTFTINIIAYIR